jgi:hypothetical protein
LSAASGTRLDYVRGDRMLEIGEALLGIKTGGAEASNRGHY